MATPTTTVVNPGTQRNDNWWLEPLLTFLGLGGFVVYATWAALQNAHFEVPGTQYLSPFYSPYFPHIFKALGIPAGFLEKAGGAGWIVSPALFILWVPAGFRTTCYYYRKAYYRAFFGAPPACGVGPSTSNPLQILLGKGRKYTGESAFPVVFQNLHRYFFYIAALFILLLTYDAVAGVFAPGWSGIRIGLGSLVLILNVVLLGLYTFSCHSWRHLLGGSMDCFSSCGVVGEARSHAWQRQSLLNEHHMAFAWMSLFSVGFADLYIRLCSMGIWHDPVLFEFLWKG